MTPGYLDDDLDDCADDFYPASLIEWFNCPDYLTETIAGVEAAAREPLPFDEPTPEAQQPPHSAEAMIARGCDLLDIHTDEIVDWKHLYEIGYEQAMREGGAWAVVTSLELQDAARRQWRAIDASRNDAMRRAA